MSTVVFRCNIYEPQDFVPDDDSFSDETSFLIDFLYAIDNLTIYTNLVLSQQHLLHDRSTWSAISSKLSEMNVPFYAHSDMIFRIIDYARSIVSQDLNVIPLVVIIKAEICEEDAISDAATRSINDQVVHPVPASQSSIEALKRTKIVGFSKQCVICLEEISIGSEATCMPCSHVYHQDCIVNWLEKSNLCPLCRFQMPSSTENSLSSLTFS
ncbi:RING-H2 finger protein ATL78-like [Pistacia vera]|uniref:RING-H2 finger protein ATL78-like n=1 Tax=Pistacia vera TaxID=55513 RepID=UPI001262B18F|nr:RING-H2 finger protein ATL78-like [Pistacia vera]